MSTNAQSPKAVVEVGAADLQGPGVVFCPNPKQALWSNHPRVYIDVVATGEFGAEMTVLLVNHGPVTFRLTA